jgi:hypothetical protein
MKCLDCRNWLAEYVDGEASEHNAALMSAHLTTCAACTSDYEALMAEQEIFARYDRELNISPALWQAIEARTTESRTSNKTPRPGLRDWIARVLAAPQYRLAGAMAVLIVGVVVGVMYFGTHPQTQTAHGLAGTNGNMQIRDLVDTPGDFVAGSHPPVATPTVNRVEQNGAIQLSASSRSNRIKHGSASQSDVLFSDIAYSDIENRDTADHIAQAENLLRSIRSIHLPDNDEEIDVTYEKAMSRRLLDQNVVLRRDAEEGGKFPVKTLLGDLEPFLIEITNLPDKTTPSELRALKDRVQKTEIVAALQSY